MKLDLMHNYFILSSCDLLDTFLFLFGCFVRICHHGCTHLTWPSDVEERGREIDLTPTLALQTHLICKCYWCTHCSLLWISDLFLTCSGVHFTGNNRVLDRVVG